ncbi:NosD domain-containing protein, partial [Candidatus Nitrosocosmicus arcticus]
MTNKKISVIPVIFLVLLLTFNTSTILSNNGVAAQSYDNKPLGSLRGVICSENKNPEPPQDGPNKLANPDDDSSKSAGSKGSESSDAKHSGKIGKVITPTPTLVNPNKLANPDDDSSKSAGSKGSAGSSADGTGTDDSSKSAGSKGSAGSDAKHSGKIGKVITPTPTLVSPNKLANPDDDSSKTGNSVINEICFDTEESNEIDKPITENNLENRESGITSISCGQLIEQSVIITSNLDCKTDGLLVGGNDIIIDLNGFTVTGPSQDSSKIGIMLTDTKNVTVQGPGTISDFQAGILTTDGKDNTISAIDFSENHVGVLVTSSSNSTIKDNRLTNNSMGIVTYSSSNSSIDTNLLKSNDLAGTALVDSDNNDIYLNTVQDSLNGIFVDGQSNNNNATFNNLVQNNEIGINNANGSPVNINNNEYDYNTCNVSIPDGLCYGGHLPILNTNASKVESIDQTEIESPIQKDGASSDQKQIGSDNESSDKQNSIGGVFNDISSGNNVALQSQDNSGSISAGQGSSDSSGSGDGSSDSSGSGDGSSDSSGSGDGSSDSSGSGTTGSAGSGTTGSAGSGTIGNTGSRGPGTRGTVS